MIRQTHRAFATTYTAGSMVGYNAIQTTITKPEVISHIPSFISKHMELPIFDIKTIAIATMVAWVVASLPDMDKVLERYHIPNLIFKHRGITHSIWPIIGFITITYNMTNLYAYAAMIGVTLGWLSHLVADAFSKAGVAWLYPFSGYKETGKGSYKKGPRGIFQPIYTVGNKFGPLKAHYYYYALTGIIAIFYIF